MPMNTIDHNQQPKDEWRAGVLTRMRVSSVTGAAQLCVFEQWCDPGMGAPTHLHAVEEILSVISGEADAWLDDEHQTLKPGQSFVIPAGRKHGFKNVGKDTLHVMATLASPVFEAAYDDKRETPRRWLPEPK